MPYCHISYASLLLLLLSLGEIRGQEQSNPSPAPTVPSDGKLSMMPSVTLMPTPLPSSNPSSFPTLTSESAARGHFRQVFIVFDADDPFFNDTELLLLENIYESYTARFVLTHPPNTVATECAIPKVDQTTSEGPDTNSTLKRIDYVCEYSSMVVDVFEFPMMFSEYVNDNLTGLVTDMNNAGIVDVAEARMVTNELLFSPAPTITLPVGSALHRANGYCSSYGGAGTTNFYTHNCTYSSNYR